MLTLLIPTKTSPDVDKLVERAKTLLPEVEVLVVGYQTPASLREAIVDKGGIFLDEPRKGKGVAVISALQKVTTPFVIMLDADGTYPVEAVPDLQKELQSGADVVVGFRHWKEEGSMTLLHKLGNLGLSLGASALYGRRIRDICSGMWGFRTEVVRGFNLVSRGLTLEAELFINVCKGNYKLTQVPIRYFPRTGGKAKATVYDGLKIAQLLVKERFKC